MVAEMAHCEAACRSGDGDGDVHTSDCKGNLPEVDGSDSEHSGTSVADSEEGSGSEEDEEDRADLEANEERDEEEEEVETGEDSSQASTGEGTLGSSQVHKTICCWRG
ncbi:uncharacterized protein LOC130405775 isoform X2 [Gadus chalcogrammus]|uniref:uncharacterized protein LOC130405775 isoform X2 n=1 Tax=Gadus chalcogrammus TaxID=1042646 RepID=UPI0024C4C1BC|nr:uncharacterized protein LOC130405775 isoform X2 [Gadus chalcogrammus]